MSDIEPASPPATPVGAVPKADVGASHSRGRAMVARFAQLTAREVDGKRYERTLLPEVSSVAEIARGFTGDGGHDGRRRQASLQT